MRHFHVTITIVLLLTVGCGKMQKQSFGPEDVAVVLADSSAWHDFEDDLNRVLEVVIRTPQFEKLMKLEWMPAYLFEEQKRRKNLIILATLDNRTGASELVKALLGEEIVQKVEAGEIWVISQSDQFAKNQEFMILTARDSETLHRKIRNNPYLIFDKFDRAMDERMSERIFGRREQKDISKKLKERHDFSFKVPQDYMILDDSTEAGFVWLVAHGLRRWFTVSWEDVDDVPVISVDWILDRRDELGITFFDSVRVNRDLVSSKRVKLGNWTAWKVTGLYETLETNLGGPFISYAFYDDATNRVFLLDGAVFAPGKEKMKFLRELDLMAKSFVTFPEKG